MLEELNRSAYSGINELRFIEFPLIRAVVQQKQTGRIFAALHHHNKEVFILNNAGFGYYFSSSADPENKSFFDFILNAHDLPEFFHLYDPPASVKNIEITGQKYNVRTRKRIILQYLHADPADVDLKNNDHTLQQINGENYDQLEAKGLINKKFWDTKADFLQNGIGVCIFDKESNPVSVCYSACVADGVAEIDVATVEEHRKKGLAKVVTGAFVNICKNKNIVANWDCFQENTGSLRTALSLGFTQIREYDFLSFYKKK